jgi:hypothetical protein
VGTNVFEHTAAPAYIMNMGLGGGSGLVPLKHYESPTKILVITNKKTVSLNFNHHRKQKFLCDFFLTETVSESWPMRLVVGVQTRRPGFNSRSVLVGLTLGEVALGQGFLRVLLYLAVSIIPSVLHSKSFIRYINSAINSVVK